MEKKSQDFSMQEATRLASTPAGKQLAQLLQQTDQQALNDVMKKAKQGNYQDAAAHFLSKPRTVSEIEKVLSECLQSEELQVCIQSMHKWLW